MFHYILNTNSVRSPIWTPALAMETTLFKTLQGQNVIIIIFCNYNYINIIIKTYYYQTHASIQAADESLKNIVIHHN